MIVAAALCAYHGMFVRLANVFSAPHEDMSHGYVVPLFSLYVLWCERKRLRERAGSPAWGGLLLMAPALLLLFFGSRGLQVRMEAVSFILFMVAVPWALWGRAAAKVCVFPALFLCFVIPMTTYLDFFTVHLRLFASSFAVGVLNGCGLEVVRHGTAIEATGAAKFAIDIAEPCSGLRSLFALMALTAAYGWFAHRTWARRLALFACSIPIAVMGNVMRIVSICLVAAVCNADLALGFYHDYSGYVIFIVAILLMLACSDVVARVATRLRPLLARRRGAASVPAAENEAAAVAAPGARFVPVLAAALAAAFTVFLLSQPRPVVMEPPPVALPDAVKGCDADAISFCHSESCCRSCLGRELAAANTNRCLSCGGELFDVSLGEYTVLPRDTKLLKRVYLAGDGYEFVATAVIGGVTKSSIHRPELCLPAQGFLMLDPHDVRPLRRPYRMIRVMRGGVNACALAYTFYNQDGYITSSHMTRILRDVWDRTVLNRVDRWVMITIYAIPPPDSPACPPEEALSRFIRSFEEVMK